MRQSYKILHIETGLYVNYDPFSIYRSDIRYTGNSRYTLSKIPYIFTYKKEYPLMLDRRLNKIIKEDIYYFPPDTGNMSEIIKRRMDKCEFIIMEIDDV